MLTGLTAFRCALDRSVTIVSSAVTRPVTRPPGLLTTLVMLWVVLFHIQVGKKSTKAEKEFRVATVYGWESRDGKSCNVD